MTYTPLFGSRLLYGADYNPEQWLSRPDILERDLELMEQAHISVLSLGMFSWAMLEPEEGRYEFAWLDQVLDNLNSRGIKVFLATPSGARPAWLSQRYPEVLRVNELRQRALHGGRHNHCMTSPVYREKVREIDAKLAERYAHHPAVIGWHISNEYGGFCHCPLCQRKFRSWLKERYGTLDKLNAAWWNTFWSHNYSSWDQIESPSPIGENAVHGLNLDWRRFTSHNALDFCRAEIDTVRAYNPKLPCTANFMEFFYDYDYFEWAPYLDFISWDSYPQWHVFKDPEKIAAYTAMNHDLMRSLKGGQPFVLMESTPSFTNWRELSVQKRPGMNTLASLQAVIHGADSVQFFQWRQSRGSSEKFHGAFVTHEGTLNTRVGREACELGAALEKLGALAGGTTPAKAALIFDTPNRWALDHIQGPRNKGLDYLGWCQDYYQPFWRRGISVDVIDETCPLDKYQLVLAPLTYMLRPGYAEKVKAFVKAGGTYVASCWSGIADEHDLCFLGGFPGPLREVMGVWEEELDSLDDDWSTAVEVKAELPCFTKEANYSARFLTSLIHPEGAEPLAWFKDGIYAGEPAVTVHKYGAGQAYYLGGRLDAEFMDSLAQRLETECGLERALKAKLPKGVNAQLRESSGKRWVLLGNFTDTEQRIELDEPCTDALTGAKVHGTVTLPPCGSLMLLKD